jgi:hypothetical protein
LLYKKGNKQRIENYRPITLTSAFLRVFEKIIEGKLKTLTKKYHLISPWQGACQKGGSSIDTAQSVLETLRANTQQSIVTKLDLSKAYDRTWIEALFVKLHKNKIRGKIWRIIWATYRNPTPLIQIKIGNHLSKPFSLPAGTKQGSVLSPLLYVLYMNDLLADLSNSGTGIKTLPNHNDAKGNTIHKIPAMMFVDDLLLLATDLEEATNQMNIVRKYTVLWKAVINPDKTEIMTKMTKKKEIKKWMKKHKLPKEVLKLYMEYLGVIISCHCDNMIANQHTKLRIKKATKTFYAMRAKGLGSKNLSAASSLLMIKNVLTPIMWYGMEIIPLKDIQLKRLDKAMKKFTETVLRIRPQASTQWVLKEADILPAEAKWRHITLALWCKRKCNAKKNIPHLNNSKWDRDAEQMANTHNISPPTTPSKFLVKKMVSRLSIGLRVERFKEWAINRKHFQLSPWILSEMGMDTKINTISIAPYASTIMNARAHTLGFSEDRYGSYRAKDIRLTKCPGINCKSPDTLGHAIFECTHTQTTAYRKEWWLTLNSPTICRSTRQWIRNPDIDSNRKMAFILGFMLEEWEEIAKSISGFIDKICQERGLHVYKTSRYN